MVEIGDNSPTVSLPEGWRAWQPKQTALPLDRFPSEEQLSSWRSKIPADLYVMDYKTPADTAKYGYKLGEMVPTRAGILELQASPHAIEEKEFTMCDLISRFYELQVDKRYGTVYGINEKGMDSFLTGGNQSDFYSRLTDLEEVGYLERKLRKLFSKKELFTPLNRLK